MIFFSDATIRQRQTLWVSGEQQNPFADPDAAKNVPDHLVIHEWKIDGNTGCRYPTTKGFNAAFFIENPGTFNVTHTMRTLDGRAKSEAKQITVIPETQPEIKVSDFDSLVAACARPGRTVSADYKAIQFAHTVDMAQGVRVKRVNVTLAPNWPRSQRIFRARYPQCVVRECNFVDKAQVGRAMAMYDRATIVDCTLDGLNDFIVNDTGSTAKFMLVQNCKQVGGGKDLREYFWFVWADSHAVCYGNYVSNAEQHCVRVDHCNLFASAQNSITNKPLPDIRQSLTLHEGKWMSSYNDNYAGGRVEVGPLGGPDGCNKNHPDWVTVRSQNVQILDPRFDFTAYANQRLEFRERTDGFLVHGGEVRVQSLSCVQLLRGDWKTYNVNIGTAANPVWVTRGYGGTPVRNGVIKKTCKLTTRKGDEIVVVGIDAENIVNEYGHAVQP